MALLFCDSFNHYDDGYELAKWDGIYSSDFLTFAAGNGRRGEFGIFTSTSNAGYVRKNLDTNYATLITGHAVKCSAGSSSNGIMEFLDGGSIQVELRANTDGSIAAYRYTTLLGTSDPGVFSFGVWNYIEAKITFHNTTGSVEVRIDGVTILNLTSQDTSYSGNEQCGSVKLTCNGFVTYWDDFYLCNTLGGLNDDFLGDVKITPLYPTSDGNSSDFTRSAGATNYENVDEAQIASEADYNYSSTVNHKELYGVTNFTATGTIFGVQVSNAIKNTDTGVMKLRALSRSGGIPADNEGSDAALSSSVLITTHIFEQEPTDVVAWTAAKINAAEFGIKVQS